MPASRGPTRKPPKTKKRPGPGVPIVRKATVRLPADIAARVRAGHPWVYREVLGSRTLREQSGDVVEVVDDAGELVGRGVYDPDSVLAVRVFSRNPDERIDDDLVRRRTAEAIRVRREVLSPDIDAYRVVNGESDGLPGLTCDIYAGHAVVHVFSPAVERFAGPLMDALESELAPRSIYEQRRFKSLGGESPRQPAELVRGSAAPIEIEVREGPLKFLVDVTAPLSTGLFLDLREGRKVVARWAKGRRVLNLFSYTGAISVYAAHGGAKEVVAVDAAQKGHARARKNFAANGMDPESSEYVTGDAQKVLARFEDRRRIFDMIILDPPAFGTSGRGQVFSASRHYRDLVESSLKVLAPGGLLVAISSTQKISHEEMDKMLAAGAARAGVALRIVERAWLPPDFCVAPGFPEGNYLKFAVCVRD